MLLVAGLISLCFGCEEPHQSHSMPTNFSPSGLAALSEVDTAEGVSYSDSAVVIQGVVSPGGQSGWEGQNDSYEVHCLLFSVWRQPGDDLAQHELTLLRPVPPNAEIFDDFEDYSVQRFQVLLSGDRTRAVVEKILSMDSADPDLDAAAIELKKPVVIPTDGFGDLVLDRRINWFEGKTTWNDNPVRITFDAENDKPPEEALASARLLWAEQKGWNQRIEDYALKELLDLKNDAWLEDGDSPLTPKDFLRRMTLTSISVSSDGEFEFWYDDGDLFWGHSIMVSGDLKDGPSNAGIHG